LLGPWRRHFTRPTAHAEVNKSAAGKVKNAISGNCFAGGDTVIVIVGLQDASRRIRGAALCRFHELDLLRIEDFETSSLIEGGVNPRESGRGQPGMALR
jgi:hypothetical protein